MKCPECKGSGKVEEPEYASHPDSSYSFGGGERKCSDCDGTGEQLRYAEDCNTADTICEYKNCKQEAQYHYGTTFELDEGTCKHYCKEHCPPDEQ